MKGRIAILGGTGTLGTALVKTILDDNPHANILVYSRDEIKQLEMMDDFPGTRFPNLHFKLGDVRDLERLTEVLANVDFVVHAAAIKHVVMAEMNPEECRKTNVAGTANVVKACNVNRVKRAMLISTDKAEKPIGIYGESKLKAEQIFFNAPSEITSFGVVRLGNIIGARGSVFEAFERQRKEGVIKVTHPDATRFCISKEYAASFILESLINKDESLFIPQMKSFRILSLAKEIAPECRIEIVGLRPGDKLHEELNSQSSEEEFLTHSEGT